jgi:hypothetical protein
MRQALTLNAQKSKGFSKIGFYFFGRVSNRLILSHLSWVHPSNFAGMEGLVPLREADYLPVSP